MTGPQLQLARDIDRKWLVVRMTGFVSLDDWAASVATQIANGLWNWASLYDFSEAEDFPCLEILPEMTTFVIEVSAQHGSRGPVAVVVPPRLLAEYRDKFEEYADAVPYAFAVFTDLAAARDWLDLKQACDPN